jgi:hypothetical protein
MERAIKLFALFFFFYLTGWGEVGRLEAVPVKPNRSIILGQVQQVQRDFPQVKLTVRIIKSYPVEEYANLIKESEIIEIEPTYTGKELKVFSFFENEINVNNLQAYYFLVGDYFFAEVSLLGDEGKRRILFLTIQRLNEESILKKAIEPQHFLNSCKEAG